MDIYFELSHSKQVAQNPVPLQQLTDIYCEDENIRQKLLHYPITLTQEITALSAMQLIQIAKSICPKAKVHFLGSTKCQIIQRHSQTYRFGRILKLVLIGLIVFFGGAIAIMNFHADVDMPTVHSNIYEFATGIADETYAPYVSIPYAIGIGFGFLFVLNIIKRKKNKEPSLIELEVHEYKNEILDYFDEKQDEGSQ